MLSTFRGLFRARPPSVKPSTRPAPRPGLRADRLAPVLRDAFGGLETLDLLRVMIRLAFPGRIAVVSSFGVESVVLLELVARVDPALPVIFLDTGKLFDETLRYRQSLERDLGLKDVRVVRPADLAAEDPLGTLCWADPDRCCHLRKVIPLEKALEPFDAWITGRKRYHGNERADLPRIESDGRRVKINPLADWSEERVKAHHLERDLPQHPLAFSGYSSVGCVPCTRAVRPGEPVRAGRWWSSEKTECGIHKNL